MDNSTLLVSAALRRVESMREDLRAERFHGGDPFVPACTALVLLAGGEAEPRAYRVLSDEEKRAAHAALKTGRHWIAHAMLEHRPELERQVLAHPAFRKKIDYGPLKRMPAPARAVRLLSKLLLDPHEVARLERRGYFAFDDGTHRAALVVDYAWRQTTGSKTWLTEKPKRTRITSGPFARKMLRECGLNPRVQLVGARLMQAWYYPDEKRTAQDERLLSRLSTWGKDDAIRVVAAQGLFELGVRSGRPQAVDASVDRIEAFVPTVWRKDAGLCVMKAWSHFLNGRVEEARELTLSVVRSPSPAAKGSVITLLQRLGEEKMADSLSRRLTRP